MIASGAKMRSLDEDPSEDEPPPLTLVDRATGRTLTLCSGHRMRTADALDKLDSIGRLAADSRVEIRTMPMRLPGGEITSCVSVLTSDPFGWGVMMPSSAKYFATTTLREQRQFDIATLNGAISDARGNVDLKDGSHVHSVKLVPTKLHYHLTPVQERIVRLVLSFMQTDGPGGSDETQLPEINFGQLRTLTRPKLKRLEHHVGRHLPNVSRFMIATAVARAGMPRIPEKSQVASRGANLLP